jgi:hypothetical protein
MVVCLAAFLCAQDRPGIDRPIRIGSFIGAGDGRFFNPTRQASNTALDSMLANPEAAGLGDSLIVPIRGFSFTRFGVTCENCSPTKEQTSAFINALDTLDVAYIGFFPALGGSVTNPLERERLLTFMEKKAFISVSWTGFTWATWPDLNIVHGALMDFEGQSSRRGIIRRDSVDEADKNWQYLNRGLFKNGLDTGFVEYWPSFYPKGESIRAGNALGSTMVTTQLIEDSLQGGLGGMSRMGDHPMSWGRRMTAGGRGFYTGVGYRIQLYQGGPSNPRFLRRQLYNAFLWTSKYDSLSQPVTGIFRKPAESQATEYARVAAFPSALKVTLLLNGSHDVSLLGLDGRRISHRQGKGSAGTEYDFGQLRPGVYSLAVVVGRESWGRLVVVP